MGLKMDEEDSNTQRTQRLTHMGRRPNPQARAVEKVADGWIAPASQPPKYHLRDLIDVEQLQALQDCLFDLYRCPFVIVDSDGVELTNTGWQDACKLFHRGNAAARELCIESDRAVWAELEKTFQPVVYRCKHGLMETSIPIMIDGAQYGNFHTGQYFIGKPDLEFYRQQARRYGFDEKAYLKAIRRVPVWSNTKRESYFRFIVGLIEVVAESGAKKLRELEARQKMEEYEEQAGAILSQMADGFWMIRPQAGRISAVNEAMCQMLGRSRDELLTMSIAEIAAFDPPEKTMERLRQTVEEGSLQYETGFWKRDGGIFDVEASLTYIASQDIVFGFYRDITERKRTEKALRERNQQFQLITDASPDALIITRIADGAVLYANRQCANLAGIPYESLLDQRTPDFYLNPADRKKFLSSLEEKNSVSNWEMQVKRGDGAPFWALISAQLGMYEGNRVIYAGFRDISELKRNESELRRRLQFETLLVEVQANFLALGVEQFDQAFVNALRVFCEFLGLERAALWQSKREEPGLLWQTHRWSVGSFSYPLPASPANEILPYLAKRVLAGQITIVDRMDDLPDEAAVDRAVLVNNGIKSMLVFPFLIGESAIYGAISFAMLTQRHAWSEETISFCRMAGQVLSGALARTQAEEALRRSEQAARKTSEQLRMVNRIGNAIASGLDLEHLRNTLREQCLSIGATDTFYVALYDDATQMLSMPILYQGAQSFVFEPKKIEEFDGLTAHLIRYPQVLYAPDIDHPPEGISVMRFPDCPIHSFAGVTLMVGERVTGVLAIQSRVVDAYSPDQVETLRLMGSQVAIAVQNSQLYERIRRALAEKEALLRELYHRTRNNMGVINSLLGLQASYYDDERLRCMVESTQNRIYSMALVHQKLYETNDLSRINLKEYTLDLVALLLQTYSVHPDRVALTTDLEEIYVVIDTAIPCGLILNELVTNALKHAFAGGRSGQIQIGLRRLEDGQIELLVSDDGVGIPAGKDLRRDGNMGIQTLFTLAEYQLNAQVSYSTQPGVRFQIRFQEHMYEKRV